jgi:hypothetical protein
MCSCAPEAQRTFVALHLALLMLQKLCSCALEIQRTFVALHLALPMPQKKSVPVPPEAQMCSCAPESIFFGLFPSVKFAYLFLLIIGKENPKFSSHKKNCEHVGICLLVIKDLFFCDKRNFPLFSPPYERRPQN